ncbi:MAG: radical SAM protein [Ktedonobacterales bacterium]|nr:radical SAM protein [Ktedonobacterales bacterium]
MTQVIPAPIALMTTAFPYLVAVTPTGEIHEARDLHALDYDGQPLDRADLIPLPPGATVAMMPGRRAVGLTAAGERVAQPATVGWALSAFLPIGYTRTRVPAYEMVPPDEMPANAETLPFFGYTALAGIDGELYVAAVPTDDPAHWLPDAFDVGQTERRVRRRLREEPGNRVLAHHAHCALDYQCPTATNLFYDRWEGAIAVSAGCNARCVGCISLQEDDGLVSPQDRLTFLPSVEEVVEVGVAHLTRAPEAILSFGQGCEGEPLLQWRLLERAIKAMRAQTTMGAININTNASNPRAVARLCAAGLDSLRASTISARPATYDAYYRPVGYGVAQIKQSLITAREAGAYTSINLLLYPGLADAEDEAAAWVDFLRETGTHLVQLRNLNIDPELLLPKLPPRGPALGIRAFIDQLHRELPDLRIGNFSVPLTKGADGVRVPLH